MTTQETVTETVTGTVALSGDTYSVRDILKYEGAKWDAVIKRWIMPRAEWEAFLARIVASSGGKKARTIRDLRVEVLS